MTEGSEPKGGCLACLALSISRILQFAREITRANHPISREFSFSRTTLIPGTYFTKSRDYWGVYLIGRVLGILRFPQHMSRIDCSLMV